VRKPGVRRDLSLRVRDLFLREENTYGCAEVSLITLQEHLGAPNAGDSSAAMALNGGIAYSGGTCGAITGTALAVGRLVGSRVEDHTEAKRAARRLVQNLMEEFSAEFGSTDCRELTGYDLTVDHEAFIESGTWRDGCMRQIEFAVDHAAALLDETFAEGSHPNARAHTAHSSGDAD
jgi:C_GCAxxG_C_C family probable redox protein